MLFKIIKFYGILLVKNRKIVWCVIVEKMRRLLYIRIEFVSILWVYIFLVKLYDMCLICVINIKLSRRKIY